MKKIVKLTIMVLLLILISVAVQAAHVHRVQPGEDLYLIAQKYGVTINEIIDKNNLRNPDNIYVKEVLIIPEAKRSYFYRVKAGDTLYKISQQLKIPIEVLRKANYLFNDNLYVKQILYIPFRYRYPQRYEIRPGDTLSKLARKHEITVKELLMLNDLNKWDTLKVGQILKIPVSKPGKNRGYTGPNYLKLYPETFYLKGSSGRYKIALTFDDGPDEKYTPQILDVLKKYNVPATFFFMGKRAAEHPEVIKQIVDEGHLIGNHTWSHANLTRLNDKRFNNEIKNTENIVKEITGLEAAFIRPPYGAVSTEVLDRLQKGDYKVIHWSVDTRDWLEQDVDKILINTLPAVGKDSIILFHSAGGKNHDLSASVEVLPELIQTLRMRGFTFVNLNELLGIPAYK